jgi:type II secretion system protein H
LETRDTADLEVCATGAGRVSRSLGNKPLRRAGRGEGFTLIELLVVMSILVMVLGIIFPALKGFFRGRGLDNEARRFLALTRLGRSRAISEAIPVELWINARQGTYGLQALSGYTESQPGLRQYTADPIVQISCSPPPSLSTLTRSNYWTPTTTTTSTATLPAIRFQPDGFISETSPRTIYFRQGQEDEIRIVEDSTHTRYEIQSGPLPFSHS